MIFLFNWVIFRFHVDFPGCAGWFGLLACCGRVVGLNETFSECFRRMLMFFFLFSTGIGNS